MLLGLALVLLVALGGDSAPGGALGVDQPESAKQAPGRRLFSHGEVLGANQEESPMGNLVSPGRMVDMDQEITAPAPLQEGGRGLHNLARAELFLRAKQRFLDRRAGRQSSEPQGQARRLRLAAPNRGQGRRLSGSDRRNSVTSGDRKELETTLELVIPRSTTSTTAEPLDTTDWHSEEDTTTLPVNIFDGQYHEVNPGQYHEDNPGQYHEEQPGQYKEENPGQYHENNPGQYEAVVQYNEAEATKSYNVHQKTGDYIIGEVGKINIKNGQTLEGVRYTAVEGMVDQEQIAEILRRYFGAAR